MYYKCLDCGHVFTEEEMASKSEYLTRLDNIPVYETRYACPACGGDYEEAHECEGCHDHFGEDELYDGKWCLNCLRDALDYDSFFEYATSNQSPFGYVDGIAEFVYGRIFNIDYHSLPSAGSYEFQRHMHEIYLREVAKDKLLSASDRTNPGHRLLDDIKSWVLDEGTESDREDFAEWLTQRKER